MANNYSHANYSTSNYEKTSQIIWYLHLYFTPAIISVGFIGNGLSIVVFLKTRLRHLSSSVYLAALCVADTLFLVQLCAIWLIYIRIFIYHKEGFCQAFIYISYVSSFLSVWFVVSFTFERDLVCLHPLQKHSVCSVYRARLIVVVISLVALVIYNFGAWTSGTVPHQKGQACIPLDKYRSITLVLNNVDTFITLIVPSLLIIYMNLRIVLKLSKFTKERKKLTEGEVEEESVSCQTFQTRKNDCLSSTNIPPFRTKKKPAVYKSQLKITKMLVTVSSIFVILNLPSHAIRIYITLVDLFNPSLDYDPPPPVALTQQVLYFMYHTNFAINFFLYSLCGQNFRLAFVSMFQTCRFTRTRN